MTNKTVKVGYISKVHGIKGEVIVNLQSNVVDRVKPGAVLICEDELLEIVESKPHQDRWIVHFKGISSRTEAEQLKGKALFGYPIEDKSQFWIDEMVGLAVVDQNGVNLGEVVALELNPASDLLVLESGYLVPLNFVEGQESYLESGVIRVNIPEGLFESEF